MGTKPGEMEPIRSGGGGGVAGQYQEVIQRIRDILAARVTVAATGEIGEIHVLARAGRPPRQIAMDVQSALLAEFGRDVDPRRMSIAQVKEEADFNFQPSRLKLESVAMMSRGARSEARVALRYGADVCEGSATGPSTASSRIRMVVDATLSALQQHFQVQGFFTVDGVTVLPLGRKEAVIVSLSCAGPRGEESYIGSSFVRHDEAEAICRATLDAVNRRLAFFVGGEAGAATVE